MDYVLSAELAGGELHIDCRVNALSWIGRSSSRLTDTALRTGGSLTALGWIHMLAHDDAHSVLQPHWQDTSCGVLAELMMADDLHMEHCPMETGGHLLAGVAVRDDARDHPTHFAAAIALAGVHVCGSRGKGTRSASWSFTLTHGMI